MHNSKLLLVEGTAGIGKSALIDLLFKKFIAEEKKKVRSLLHLDQAFTYYPLNPDRPDNSLTKEENLQHLDAICQILSWCVNYVPPEPKHRFHGIIETLHITHCFRPGVLQLKEVLGFDRQLAELGCRLLFIKVNSETLWERCIKSRPEGESLTTYWKKYGRTLNEIHDYFVQEQELMGRIVEKSAMPKLVIELDGPIYQSLEETYTFWMQEQ